MLKEWILNIQQDSDHYCSETWKFHISGNVLELSILPQFTKNKQIYRSSVITIGQVLRAISCKIEDAESHFLIQSFPSIESPEIIASIRMDKNSYHNDSFPSCDPEYDSTSILSRIEVVSGLYQFTLMESDPPDDKFIPEGMDKNSHSWYALTSKFDNPFTWLNVGYWKETMLRGCREGVNTHESATLIDFCNHSKWNRPALKLPGNGKLQAFIAIEK
jgi:hypothetical protein